MSTVCIWAGTCAGGRFDRRVYVGVTSLHSHFSICIVLATRLILKRRTILTRPWELANHHCASFLSLRNVSDTPTSKTSVGQSIGFGWVAIGLQHELASFFVERPLYVVAPISQRSSRSVNPMCSIRRAKSCVKALVTLLCSFVGTLIIKVLISVQ